jgi:flagellum-specific peptidoglycan hydrolase FlgJ
MMAGVFPPEVIAAACASQARWDVPASVCLAQWALESGWGRAMPPRSNNPFGIKARSYDPAVVAMTREVVDGRSVRLPQRFRKFPTLDAAFAYHGRLLATGAAYAAARAVRHDGRAFARALQGHYATDPDYAAHLLALIDAHDLCGFDRPAA